MKITVNELRIIVGDVLAEAKKKKKVEEKPPKEPHPGAYRHAEALDFSTPLGDSNPYKIQGQANFGPYTANVSVKDDVKLESLVRGGVSPGSAWAPIVEELGKQLPPPESKIWESALHYYDHMGLGLGEQTVAGIEEKKVGFAKLASKLSRQKGVTDPTALAASIGRKKYGKKAMAHKAAAGKKK